MDEDEKDLPLHDEAKAREEWRGRGAEAAPQEDEDGLEGGDALRRFAERRPPD